MQIFDFDGYQQNLEAYGGKSGYKLGINFKGERYLLKFPGLLKGRNMKNVELSYSTSPISEYIGSHIYEVLNIPVHETILGKRENKIVVGCKDFRKRGEELIEFEKIKVTFSPEETVETDRITNGTGTELSAVLNTIEHHPVLKSVPGVMERFWDMFVVDALIGNTDRNNGNWGILKDLNDNIRLAPVYDNGNSFANKASSRQMEQSMKDEERMANLAYIARTCVFKKNGKNINPYTFIASLENAECNLALERVVPQINVQKLYQVVDETPVIGEIEKEFCKKLLEIRCTKILFPAYEKVKYQKYEISKNLPEQGHEINRRIR